MFVWIHFSLYTCFKIKSIVLSRDTLANRLFTSKEIILCPPQTFCSLDCFIRSSVFKMLYSDLLNVSTSLFKYLAVLSVAVPTLLVPSLFPPVFVLAAALLVYVLLLYYKIIPVLRFLGIALYTHFFSNLFFYFS